VIQTAFGNKRFIEHAVNMGAAEILRKPIRVPEIDRALCRFLETQGIGSSNDADYLTGRHGTNPRECSSRPIFSPIRTVGGNLQYRFDQTFVRQT
jgi:hypothetical protein